MTHSHPERTGDVGFEPGVGELLTLREACEGIDRADPEALRRVAKSMAQQCLVTYPAALRWLARQAAQNLAQAFVPNPPSQDAMEGFEVARVAPESKERAEDHDQ